MPGGFHPLGKNRVKGINFRGDYFSRIFAKSTFFAKYNPSRKFSNSHLSLNSRNLIPAKIKFFTLKILSLLNEFFPAKKLLTFSYPNYGNILHPYAIYTKRTLSMYAKSYKLAIMTLIYQNEASVS